ncbi:MAG: hypothetical protein IKN57_11650 [Parasporobacterium sp.]|nr:hypothetical protein [Parasporobacterium sp.]
MTGRYAGRSSGKRCFGNDIEIHHGGTDMEIKRLTLFAGHYGSGKTNIALNYALYLRKQGYPVTMADLDIVNPYFRMKDSEKLLLEAGIEFISSPYANSNLDAPAMPKEAYALVSGRKRFGVLDIGGDDRGALALGRYVPEIKQEADYEMLFVANRARPLTRNAKDAFGVLREIEEACGLTFTAIVNNTNYGPETTKDDILESMAFAHELSGMSGLPVKMTCVKKELLSDLEGKIADIFPLDLQKLYYMLETS